MTASSGCESLRREHLAALAARRLFRVASAWGLGSSLRSELTRRRRRLSAPSGLCCGQQCNSLQISWARRRSILMERNVRRAPDRPLFFLSSRHFDRAHAALRVALLPHRANCLSAGLLLARVASSADAYGLLIFHWFKIQAGEFAGDAPSVRVTCATAPRRLADVPQRQPPRRLRNRRNFRWVDRS